MEIIKQLQWRYATKIFDADKKIEKKDFEELMEATRLSPSSYGLQLWKVFVVTNPAIREQLKTAAYGQGQVTDASHLVVFATPKVIDEKSVEEFIALTAETRSVPADSLAEYKAMLMGTINRQQPNELRDWATKQVYISLGFLLESAALKNIDSCPMEGFNSKKFDEILNLEERGYESKVICVLGYRSEKDTYASAKKVRFPDEKMFEEIK